MHVRWKPKVMFEALMLPSVMPKRRLKNRPKVMHVRINLRLCMLGGNLRLCLKL